MGVKLKDIIQPEPINFKDLKGRAISIDAFNTLYQSCLQSDKETEDP